MNLLRKIAIVFVPVYWVITWFYHQLYNLGILKSIKFKHPIICVGNLTVGGTGKTPMIEYLIALLSPRYKIATLSRGYKRKTSGFLIADKNATAESIGDEPYQLHRKFQNIIIAVDEKRSRGIRSLLNLKDKPEVILLDDAFQHRQVKAGLNILLTAYDDLYCNDIMMPTGNLREPSSGASRADVVVVTKCPMDINMAQKQNIEKQLNLKPHQSLFFSSIQYEPAIKNDGHSISLNDLKAKEFTLVTGIANPTPMVNFLTENDMTFKHLEYADHHFFTSDELAFLNTKPLVVTTEKDFVRMSSSLLNHNGLYYLPISVSLDSETRFNEIVKTFISAYSSIEA